MVLLKTLQAEAGGVCIPKILTCSLFCMQKSGASATLKL